MSLDGGLRKIFRERLPGVDFVSVETSRSERGVPDTNYCVAGVEGWMEFKKVRGRRVRISPEQVGWAERRMRRGGKVLLAARDEGALWIFSGLSLRELRGQRLDDVPSLALWEGGPSRWDWDEVLAILMTTPDNF